MRRAGARRLPIALVSVIQPATTAMSPLVSITERQLASRRSQSAAGCVGERFASLLVLQGERDDVVDLRLAAYEQALSLRWFVTLLGAERQPAFTDDASRHDEPVTRTVLDLWHGTLDGDAEALDRVTADASDPALASVQHEYARGRAPVGAPPNGWGRGGPGS